MEGGAGAGNASVQTRVDVKGRVLQHVVAGDGVAMKVADQQARGGNFRK